VLVSDGERGADTELRLGLGGNASNRAAEGSAQIAATDTAEEHTAETKRGSESDVEFAVKLVFEEVAVLDVVVCGVFKRQDEAAECGLKRRSYRVAGGNLDMIGQHEGIGKLRGSFDSEGSIAEASASSDADVDTQ